MSGTITSSLVSRVQIHESADTAAILQLVEEWPYKPYGYLSGRSAHNLARYLINSMATAGKRGAVSFLAKNGDDLRGLLQLEMLPFDTEILGFQVGRISWMIDDASAPDAADYREALLDAAIDEAYAKKIRYLLVRVPSQDISAVQLIESRDFRLVDGLLTFGAPVTELEKLGRNSGDLTCRPFCNNDLPILLDIAATSFSIDRFHADPCIGQGSADALHRKWVENSCFGFADCVLVADEGGEPVGFITLKIDQLCEPSLGLRIGVVVLVATSRPYRRKGVANRLTSSAISWFSNAGCQWVEVGTQLGNISASRVYAAAGFKLVNTSLTFRKLMDGGTENDVVR